MSNETKTNESPSTPKFGQDVNRIKQEVGNTVNEIRDTVKDHGEKIQKHALNGVDHARQDLGDSVDHAKTSLKDISGTVHGYVQERPYAFIVAGLALGFLLGLSRRRS